MKNMILLILLLMFISPSWAALTNTTIPVTKNGASNPPTLQNGSITDLGTSSGAGNVGIGSPNPGHALDVNGTISATDILGVNNTTFTVCSSTANSHWHCDYKGNGTSDQTAINSCLTAATALANGGKCLLSEGTFNITASIVPKPNVWLQGSGWSTVLAATSSLTGTAIIQDNTNYSAGTPLLAFGITDIQIDGTNFPSGYNTSKKDIFIQYVKQNFYRNIYAHNSIGTCIGIDYNIDTSYTNNLVSSCGNNGIGLGTNSLGTDNPTVVSGNIVENTNTQHTGISGNGILIEDGNVTTGPNRHFIISNNLTYNNIDGIRIAGSANVLIQGNDSWGNSGNGLNILNTDFSNGPNPTDISIVGNDFYDNTLNGIYIENETANSIIISDNIIDDNQQWGIKTFSTNTLITGNIIQTNQLDGIQVVVSAANVDAVSILDNNILNNGQAATATEENGVNVSVGGSKTLTSLDISNNHIWDNQGSKTQAYGVYVNTNTSTLTRLIIKNNNLNGNVTSAILLSGNAPTAHEYFGNSGYTTEGDIVGNTAISSGNVGIGTNTFLNALDVNGGLEVGANYAGRQTPTASGASFQGNVGIGTFGSVTQPLVISHSDSTAYTTNETTPTASIDITNQSQTLNVPASIVFTSQDSAGANAFSGSINSIKTNATSGSVSNDFSFITRNSGTSNEKFRITASGNVGIGTSGPLESLGVNGNLAIGHNANIGIAANVPSFGLYVEGNVGIGTLSTAQALVVNGSIVQKTEISCSTGLTTDANGVINGCVASDENLKTNIINMPYNPNLIQQLNPVTYQWKDNRDNKKIHDGFIAQQIGTELPEAVVPAGGNYHGVDPNAVLSVVVKEEQAQRVRLDWYEKLFALMFVLVIGFGIFIRIK